MTKAVLAIVFSLRMLFDIYLIFSVFSQARTLLTYSREIHAPLGHQRLPAIHPVVHMILWRL